MLNEEMYALGSKRSIIRELFEYGKTRAAELGNDKVFDFSIGNPNVPAPPEVTQKLAELIANTEPAALHGYSSAQGDPSVRAAVASSLNKRFGVPYTADNIYMTCGASAALAITIRALCQKGDEFVIFAPYFPEYEVFIKSAGGKPVTVAFDANFDIDFDSLEKAVSKRTKALVVNSPNNPSGAVYGEQTVSRLAEFAKRFEKKHGRPLFIIADEPYRELVYGDEEPPFVPSFYYDTIYCYSFSKSLSLPGERIGYIAVSPKAQCADEIYLAVMGAGRALGYVCAPVLFQRLVAECTDSRPNISAYRENRDLLVGGLTEIGYECAQPKGAFYLFVKSPIGSSVEFAHRAKEYGLILVPADDFAASGWMRIAYCVSKDTILRALPAFRLLFDSCR